MITKRSLAYIAVIQFAFSALDIFARNSLRGHVGFWTAISGHWFVLWLCLQALIAPFQIRLITRHGLGRGVALMNAFSVLYALAGGVLVLHETATAAQCVAALLVVLAVWLMLTPKKTFHPVVIPSIAVPLGDPYEQEVIPVVRPGHAGERASPHYSDSEPALK